MSDVTLYQCNKIEHWDEPCDVCRLCYAALQQQLAQAQGELAKWKGWYNEKYAGREKSRYQFLMEWIGYVFPHPCPYSSSTSHEREFIKHYNQLLQRAEHAEARVLELEKVCRALYLEDYQCFMGENGTLVINCNDVFCPAADAEDVPSDKLDEVLAIIEGTPHDTKDATVRYDKLMEWVGKQRGAEPFAWRKR